jgi:hypothetical protein
MTSLVRFPTKSDAFSEYRPSTNAYNNFLLPQTLGKRKESGIGNAQSQVIAIDFKRKLRNPDPGVQYPYSYCLRCSGWRGSIHR